MVAAERGVDRPALPAVPRTGLPADAAYVAVHRQLALDAGAGRSLTAAGGPEVDPHALRLYAETAGRTTGRPDEHPASAALADRCWRMLAELWHVPEPDLAVGVATADAPEAALLAGLALKRRWQQGRWAAGETAERPSLVLSAGAHERWSAVCAALELTPRFVPVSEDRPVLDGSALPAYLDESTVGVVASLAVVPHGRYDRVDQVAAALDRVAQATHLDIRLHVDAATAGLVAPFLDPDLAWDFRLPRVDSVATSAEASGLVSPTLGWLVWRSWDGVPDDVARPATGTPAVALARLGMGPPTSQVAQQYYAFVRHGRAGMTELHSHSRRLAHWLADRVAAMPELRLWHAATDLPVVAWRAAGDQTWDLTDLDHELRALGWLVPPQPLPDDLADDLLQHVVVRHDMTEELVDRFVADLTVALGRLGR